MSDTDQPQGAVMLLVQDSCNPYLADLRIACESYGEALALSNDINVAFPMCPHGRVTAIDVIDTPETMRAKLDKIREEMGKREEEMEERKHKRIMAFISNVEDGSMVATLNGDEIDSFQLASMSDEELAEVRFERTQKGNEALAKALGVDHVTVVEIDPSDLEDEGDEGDEQDGQN